MKNKEKRGKKDENEKVKVFLPVILDPPLTSGVGCQPKTQRNNMSGMKRMKWWTMSRLKSTIVT